MGQVQFLEETRDKIISGIFKYPNVHIWSLNMYIRYSNIYIMPCDCFQHFSFNFFSTFIDNISYLVLYIHVHKG